MKSETNYKKHLLALLDQLRAFETKKLMTNTQVINHLQTIREFSDNILNVSSTSDRTFIEQAFCMAYEAHYGVTRKDGYTPYLYHVIRVASRTFKAVENSVVGEFELPSMIAGALLHDTVEDTDTTYQDIEEGLAPYDELLAEETVSMVFWLTDIPAEGNPRAIRKRLSSERIACAPLAAQIVKLQDIADNTNTSDALKDEFFVLFCHEKLETLDLVLQSWEKYGVLNFPLRSPLFEVAYAIGFAYYQRVQDFPRGYAELIENIVNG